MAERMLVDGLVTESGKLRLVGGRPLDGGQIVFPFPEDAEAARYERVALSPVGRLWSWTIQRFRPKSPPYGGSDPFEPFAMGYVELPGEVIVESRIVNVPFADLSIGMALALTTVPFRTDPDGTVRTIFAFEPATGSVGG